MKFYLFFERKILILVLILLCNSILNAQDELKVIQGGGIGNNWIKFSDAPNSLYHHLSGEAYQLLNERKQELSKLHSLPDWQERQENIYKILTDIVGPFPEKTSLNAKVVSIINKKDFRIENIIYESQPNLFVTSSLFIPSEVKGQAPTIIYCSGHTGESYRNATYQHVILNLVKKGFIVFAFDPVGQGERLQYYDPIIGSSSVGGPTTEHSYSGVQALITGNSQAKYMIWDGIRAVDYLLTRVEVDPKRIGITGRSGGGTQTAYIAALDKRIQAAAPENFITNFTRLLQSIGPQDAEQNLSAAIAKGIDHADLLTVRAPSPSLLIATTNDFFSIHGARETAQEVRNIYKAYGKENYFQMVEDDADHSSTKKNREALYAFFQTFLENHGNSEDQEVELLSEEELRVTKTGQVSTSLGGETIFSLNRRKAKKLMVGLQKERKNLENHLIKVPPLAKTVSGYREPVIIEEPVLTGRILREGYIVEKYFLKGEGEYIIPYLLMIPNNPNGKALIYLHPLGKAAEASKKEEIEWFVNKGFIVLAPDLIGMGETSPDEQTRKLRKEWRTSILINRSIVGIRAGDVVRLNKILTEDRRVVEVYGLARRDMVPVLLYAAAFDSSISRIALIGPSSSFQSMVMKRFYNPSFFYNTVPGSLKFYDLPDLAASLAPRKLMMTNITDGLRTASDSERNIMDDLSFIRIVYDNQNASEQLEINKSEESDNKLYDLFLDWLKE